MKPVYPYIIQHIDLAREDVLNTLPLPGQPACYCLFWWKQVPLAHLFFEQNTWPGKSVLLQQVITAIEPAIRFYSKQPAATGIQALLDKNQPAFRLFMEQAFNSITTAAIPEQAAISVVICTRNRSRMLQHCLGALQQQACIPREIIVVDNAPDDNSTEQVVARYPGVIYCRESRPGLDIARNTGARIASSPIVAYTDDDVVLHPHWVYRVWQVFENSQVAAMTGLVIASSLDTESQQLFEKYWSFNRGYQDKLFTHSFLQTHLSSGPPVWEIGAGANMAFRKSALEQVGYFDERLDVGAAGCSGDSEIWFRLLKQHLPILYSPLAVVYHEHRKDMQALHKQIFNYMRGFAAAALIQQAQHEQANYRSHLYKTLPRYYTGMLLRGFPAYPSRYKTIFSEIRGLIAGVRYFKKHKHKPPYTTREMHA